MWSLFGEHAQRFGYSSFGGQNCHGYAPIDDFKLGSRKEFGSKRNKWLAGMNENTGAVRSLPITGADGSVSGKQGAPRTVGGIPVRRGKTKKSKGFVGRGTNADLFDYRLHDQSYTIKQELLDIASDAE